VRFGISQNEQNEKLIVRGSLYCVKKADVLGTFWTKAPVFPKILKKEKRVDGLGALPVRRPAV